MTVHIFWEIVKYSEYPSFVGLFQNKRHITKFNYLSQNLQGQKAKNPGTAMEIVKFRRKIIR